MRSARSLEFRLPLFILGLLTVVLAISLALTYATLSRSAVAAAHERLRRTTRQLATLADSSIRLSRVRYRAAARDANVREALASFRQRGALDSSIRDRARAALAALVLPADSGLPVQLWTAGGRLVTELRGADSGGVNFRASRPEIPEASPPREQIIAALASDSTQIGPFYAAGDEVRFDVVIPVRDGERRVGYIVQRRRVAGNPRIQSTIRELMGASTSTYYRNADGSFWATVGGRPADPAVRQESGESGEAHRPGVGDVIYEEAAVVGTPYVIVIELPRPAALALARSTLETLALMSLALIAGGALLAWLIGRRVTGPLGRLTRAAGAIAGGDYDARVPVAGDAEVARLAASFNRMAEEIARSRRELEQRTSEAQAANSAKSEFLAKMSHELRTPLNAIAGYAELMEMGLRGPITEAQRRDLERIRSSQQYLLGLISAVLDLSRIESGRVAYESAPLRLDPFLAGLDELVSPQVSAKSIRMEYVPSAPDLTVVADREKLRQVLLNLLSNAIRHTPPGGRITLSASPVDDALVEIRVHDTGPGIPEDRHEDIFEPFVQLDRSLTQPSEGIGLGLAISRDLARGMGGELNVRSSLGEGAAFILTLARGEPDQADAFLPSAELPVAGAEG